MWKGSISMSCCDWHMFCFLCFSDDKNAEKIFFMSVILVSCSDLSYSFCQLSVSSFLCFSLSFFSLIVKNNQCLHISVTLLFGTSYSVFSLFLKLAFLHLLVCLWIMDPHSRAPKKNTSHGNEVLLQDTTHLIQRPCYQSGSSCQDPAGNRTTQRPDHHKEMQTAVVWSCLLFIRSGQNHFARHSEREKKTRQTEKEVGRQHQGMDRPWVCQVPEGSGEQGKMEETGCEIIFGAPMTLAVKG